MELIPAIDIIEGKCVRLSQGDYGRKKVYNEDPLEVAKMFEDWGFRRLHLVDLDGAKAKCIVNHHILETIASSTGLIIDFGGGIKSDRDIRTAFEAGAQMVTGGSIAVTDPYIFINWLETYGNDKIILGADHKNGKIAVSGWMEKSDEDLLDFISGYCLKGIKKVICTDISKDGMLKGPSLESYRAILLTVPEIELIASGGVSSMKDIDKLKKIGVFSAIVGKALYEGRITESEIREFYQ